MLKISKHVCRSFLSLRQALSLALAAGAAGSCGQVSSKNLPPLADSLRPEDAPSKQRKLAQLWKEFAAAIGISYRDGAGKSEGDLNSELAALPSSLGDQSYAKLTDDLVSSFTHSDVLGASPVYSTRCARIERITPLPQIAARVASNAGDGSETALPSVRLYKFEYILKAESPAEAVTSSLVSTELVRRFSTDSQNTTDVDLGDQVVRTALLLIPSLANGTKVPLVIYGHGGDRGLSYTELKKVFGSLQQSAIIAAPSFPNEPICEAGLKVFSTQCSGETIGKPTGVSKPFDTDANEILGLQDCIARAVLTTETDKRLKLLGLQAPLVNLDSHSDNGSFLNESLSNSLLRYQNTDSSDPFARVHPVSIIVGASRGSTTGLIALAKAQAAWKGFRENEGRILLSRFQCGAFLFPPTTFTMGKLRIGLELFVNGLAEYTSFYALPLAEQLSDFFKDYREGNLTTIEMVDKFRRIDPLLNIHLIASALRDWSDQTIGSPVTGKPGQILLLHGRQDKVVEAENSVYFGRLLGKASERSKANGWGPGVRASVLSLTPALGTSFPTGNPIADALFQHGDSVFLNSTTVGDNSQEAQLPGWQIATQSGYPENYNTDLMNTAGLTPATAMRKWLKESCLAQYDTPIRNQDSD